MKKRIPFMPLETVTFEMMSEDGETVKDIDFTFNNYAILTLTQEFGDMNVLFKEYESRPYDITAMLLYAGVKPNMTEFTLEESRAIVASGGTVIIEEVTRLVIESLMILGGDDAKKKVRDEFESDGDCEVEEFPIEDLYYYYCFIMNRSEDEFLKSSFSKVFWVVDKDIHRNNNEKEQEHEEMCTTMKQFLR